MLPDRCAIIFFVGRHMHLFLSLFRLCHRSNLLKNLTKTGRQSNTARNGHTCLTPGMTSGNISLFIVLGVPVLVVRSSKSLHVLAEAF